MSIPDNYISTADLIAHPRSKVAEIRERRPVQGYTDGKIQKRGSRGMGDGGSGGYTKTPGRLNTWGRVDEIRYRGEGVDDRVYFLNNHDEGAKGRGGGARAQEQGAWGRNRNSKDENG